MLIHALLTEQLDLITTDVKTLTFMLLYFFV